MASKIDGDDLIPTLDQKIEELDSLIPERNGDARPLSAAVPVLDEPAEAVTPDTGPATVASAHMSPAQLVDLSHRLQQRLDQELGELTTVLRGVIRRCIQEELRRELPPATAHHRNDTAATAPVVPVAGAGDVGNKP